MMPLVATKARGILASLYPRHADYDAYAMSTPSPTKTIGLLAYDDMQALDLAGPLDVFGGANSLAQNGVRSTYRRLKVGKIGKINGKKGVRDNFGAATGVVKLSLAPFFAHLSSLSAMAASPRQSRAISL